MAEPAPKGTRMRSAARAREAILDAAEAAFAEHGLAGARFDAIAKAAGYNSSLSDFVPIIQLTMLWHVCQSYLGCLPLYQAVLPGEDVTCKEVGAAETQGEAWADSRLGEHTGGPRSGRAAQRAPGAGA